VVFAVRDSVDSVQEEMKKTMVGMPLSFISCNGE
jgi:hypothetical protein